MSRDRRPQQHVHDVLQRLLPCLPVIVRQIRRTALGVGELALKCFERLRTREDLRSAIVHWFEPNYNRRRHQRGLGRLTLVELELAFTDKPDEAAV